MTTLSMAEVIRNVHELPPLPAVVMELLGSLGQEDANVADLAEKVSHDQALAAKTLRLANSSFYGMQSKVATIQQAIAVLGFDSVRTLVTAASVTSSFYANDHSHFNFNAFWRHAIGTALCAKSLAQRLNVNRDYAFIVGLLHDIGKLVLVTRYPADYARAIAYRDEHDCTMLEAERSVLGLDHSAVGKALTAYWKFPLVMQDAVGQHHGPFEAGDNAMSMLAHVSDAIAHALDLSGTANDLVPEVSDIAWDILKLPPEVLLNVFTEIEKEFEESCQILV